MSAPLSVLYFAAAREAAGTSREELPCPEGTPTVRDVLSLLATAHPALERLLPHLRVAVDQEFSSLDAPVPPGSELALIPPVAGGAGAFRVADRVISVQEVLDAVQGEAFGGLVTFVGSVRDRTQGRRVVKLEYEAYAPMAEKKLQEIGGEISSQWPGTRVSIVHRVGTLVPGELAVAIAVAAPHRKEAFRGCEHAIERLKQDVPIWKKEHFEDGEVWVGLGP